ncbi:winged helix-turn-helix transcriptional regulator [Fibrobacter intestinalis]|uniref:winged helix-turn-helix domain-containing protein n=1 Tax=Fibrobacter intestinalis TaxID=28122 RepID=UPI0023EF8E39|nr:winged helix-turn-helix transcriptional regulator [Fibrobacter intestinalis]MDD7299259.1 winged helix-turn-helix transcriptional regulator [Fibrobacter intestinalis]
MIDLIKANPRGSYDEYAKIRNVSSSTIKRHLQNLKDKGVIERKGAKKNRFWEVVDQKEK